MIQIVSDHAIGLAIDTTRDGYYRVRELGKTNAFLMIGKDAADEERNKLIAAALLNHFKGNQIAAFTWIKKAIAKNGWK